MLYHHPNYPEPGHQRGTAVRITGGRFSPPRANHSFPPDAVTPPLAGVWAHAHDVTPRAVPHSGPTWADRPRGRARAFGWTEFPPGPS
jgi:hypothetical protein